MTPALVFGIAVLLSLLTRRRWNSGTAPAAVPPPVAATPAGFDPARYGLTPSAELDPGRAGPPLPLLRRKELEALADSCLAGGWRAAAAYVTAAGDDWDERWSRLDFLTQVAAARDAWLTAWQESGAEACAAATVHARLLAQRAWEARDGADPQVAPAERAAAFKALLAEANTTARRAAELDPRDPGPWVVLVTTARGVPLTRRQFRPLWEELTARAPHHVAGHWQAMRYWCARWHGSDALMLRFAERAVRTAPPGSVLPGLYLQALAELEQRHGPLGLPDARRLRELLPMVASALAAVPPPNDQLPLLRHLLAHFALVSQQPDLALEQFRELGPWCGAHPWTATPHPVRAFDHARAVAATYASA
ncbi:hypothetical protein ACFV4P_15745 [Kitasatospora sp. NPDC059795]|uniref:hypothetical protein n=1 Tax=Kitasatospora sp. NPDC059795 TaxID=3346949 RepID=UPI00365A8953